MGVMKNLSEYIEQMINGHFSWIQVDVELKDEIYHISTNYVSINTSYSRRQKIVRELIVECLKQYLPNDFTNYKIIINR
jgi:hypothetical protein